MITLIGNRVAVKLDAPGEQKTDSGLYLAGEPPKGARRGIVKAVGGEYVAGSFLRKALVSVGEAVLVDELGGQPIKVDKEELLIVRNEDIIGVLS